MRGVRAARVRAVLHPEPVDADDRLQGPAAPRADSDTSTTTSRPDFVSALALVHQRFSTNTFPTWDRAHPYRFIAHNGEINTLRGNVNWMHARQSDVRARRSSATTSTKLFPIIDPAAATRRSSTTRSSCSSHTGRSLPHAVMMMIPEAWQNHESMSPTKRAFYEYHACLMEPWDGPASIAFTDGTRDRRGARPQRPAPVALRRHQGRPRRHGVRGRRARHRARERRAQGPPAARPHVPGRHRAGPHRRRRGDQGGDGGAQAVPPVARRRTSSQLDDLPQRPTSCRRRSTPTTLARAPAGVRLHASRTCGS